MKKIITTILASLALCAVFTLSADITSAADAVELTPEYATSNGASVYDMTGGSYDTMSTFNSGDTITISSSTPIAHLYIAWNNKTVSPWTLTLEDGSAQECGTNGYLHEYVKLDKPSTKAVINIKADGMKICKLYAFGEGDVPSWVQQWNPPCDEADILLVSTHADDEQLFFGGIIPYYAGELGLKVQVAYYTNYWNGANIREHEKLDGLWTVGVRNISVNGDFDDIYATSLEAAKEVYSYNDTVAFMTELIRRFKPLVLVGQDLNGEYGHGGHMITSAAICDAVNVSADAASYPESADKYGTYDVPKTYLHLYPENQINLDCRRALSRFGGKTVLEVAADGYLQHASQQWCWFYVSDDYQYSCAKFGLYRSTVGADTGNDILENVVTYEEQARIKAEEESSRQAESESESIAQSIAESEAQSESESESAAILAEQKSASHSRAIITVVIAVVVIVILLFVYIIIRNNLRNSRRRKKRKIR